MYSPLDGTGNATQYAEWASTELGHKWLALTDHATLGGALDHIKACRVDGDPVKGKPGYVEIDSEWRPGELRHRDEAIIPIVGCLLPDQTVTTDDGVKCISDIKPGDKVLTHKGRFRPVLDVMMREYKGNIRTFDVAGCSESWITDEHPVLVIDKHGVRKWVKAKEVITQSDGRKVGTKNRAWASSFFIPKIESQTNPNISCDVAWMMGLFIAEGSFGRYKNGKANCVNFSLHSDEIDFAERIDKALSEIGVRKSRRYDRKPDRNSLEVVVGSVELANKFESMFGSGCRNKRIPIEILQWPSELRLAFVQGVVDGDGSVKNNTVLLKMANRNILYSIRTILASEGILIRIKHDASPSCLSDDIYYAQWTQKSDRRRYQSVDDGIIAPVHRVKTKQYSGPVYNLHVDEDNSYVTEYATHNCEVFWIGGDPFGSRLDKTFNANVKPHLCLHASGAVGWHNLIKITTEANISGFHGVPRVDFEILEKYSDGIHATTACLSSPVCRALKEGDYDLAIKFVTKLKQVLNGRVWVAIMGHDVDDQRLVNPGLVNIAEDTSSGLVAESDAHYPIKEWGDTQEIVFAISFRQTLKSRNETKEEALVTGDEVYGKNLGSAYLMSAQEMIDLFAQHHPDIPESVVIEAIKNTGTFARQIRPPVINKDPKFPSVTKTPEEAEEILRRWAEEGFVRERKRRPNFADLEQQYRDQLEFELKVLRDRDGGLDYFVLAGKEIRRARECGVRTGVRGSAAGCLLSYLIGIIDLDPIAYGLMFERFLNPDRKGYPDIDFDMPTSDPDNNIIGRDELIEALIEEYGEDHVAHVITYSTFAPRAAVTEISKYFDNGPDKVDFMDSKKLKEVFGATDKHLEELLKKYPEVRTFAEKNPEPWKHMLRIDDMIKGPSKHASAIIVSKEPIVEHAPINRSRGRKGEEDTLVVAWADRAEHPIISEYGLFKLDYLGLAELTKHEYTCQTIQATKGEYPDFRELEINWDPYAADPKVMDAFKRGLTLGVFQFGSAGITQLVRAIKPDSVLDLTAANALYRPGGMEFAFDYAKRKRGEQAITYWHDAVIPFLEETFGLVAYQEQVMNICKALGGFSPGQADSMRKAISKLYRMGTAEANKFMERFREQWDEGCREKGISKTVSDTIWESILKWGGYGFNKSHSATYAILAYIDMWLKVYYPHEFYAALLTYPGDLSTSDILREARILGVDIMPPDVNESQRSFVIDEDGLRYGLLAINNIGGAAAHEIVANRPYENFVDYVEKRSIGEALNMIKAGAFDKTDDRYYLLSKVLKFDNNKFKVKLECGCAKTLVNKPEETVYKCTKHGPNIIEEIEVYNPEWTVAEQIAHNLKLKKKRPIPEEQIVPSAREINDMEKAALGGIALAGASLIVDNAEWIEARAYTEEEFNNMPEGDDLNVAGEVISTKEVIIKNGRDKGRKMCFFDLQYGENHYSCTMFADTYEDFKELLGANAVMVYGRKDTWKDKSSIIVEDMGDLETLIKEDNGNS